jgi:hypothetical protein
MPRPMAAGLIIDGKTHILGEDLKDFVKQNINIKREIAEKSSYRESSFTRKKRRNMMKQMRGTRIKIV